MWPPPRRSVAVRAAWLCALLAAAAVSGGEVYGKLGGEVSLTPSGFDGNITTIIWKEGADMAIEWDGKEEDRHRHYKDRGRLDRTSGVMTITGLERSDSKVYTPEINNKEGTPIRLIVISAVPVPTIVKQCNEETTACTLTCSADTAEAGVVTYKWKSDDNVEPASSQKHEIKKDASVDVKEFTCELENPVSRESSQPIPNPFTPAGGVKVSNGIIVFSCLLSAVVLLVAFHRLKAGEWFYEKGSMPWQAEFWKKNETAPRAAAASNGASAAAQQNPADEETALT